MSAVVVSIPQAVSAVATFPELRGMLCSLVGFNTASGKCCCNYSTSHIKFQHYCFNTASGKCCCNFSGFFIFPYSFGSIVSIPQAVSAVATI